MKQDSDLRNGLKSIKTRQAISDVESGQRAPSIAMTIRLALHCWAVKSRISSGWNTKSKLSFLLVMWDEIYIEHLNSCS